MSVTDFSVASILFYNLQTIRTFQNFEIWDPGKIKKNSSKTDTLLQLLEIHILIAIGNRMKRIIVVKIFISSFKLVGFLCWHENIIYICFIVEHKFVFFLNNTWWNKDIKNQKFGMIVVCTWALSLKNFFVKLSALQKH